MQKSPITTHVLDTALGKPARGVAVALEFMDAGVWHLLGKGVTDDDGRLADLLPPDYALRTGAYRLTFETGAYFEACGVRGFYSSVTIAFDAREESEHYHVPLLLNPFGYSTYRGS